MVQTFCVTYQGVAFAATKPMAAIVNTHASELLKIRRVFLTNPQTVAVTGVVCQIDARIYTGAGLSGHTAVTPVPYDTANTAPLSAIYGYAGTLTGTPNIIRRILWSSDEAAVSSMVSDELENFPPLNLLYEWIPHSDIQPITLRQNDAFVVYNVSGGAGLLDVAIEFTKE